MKQKPGSQGHETKQDTGRTWLQDTSWNQRTASLIAPNRVQREFTVVKPNQVWVTDIVVA